MNNIEIAYATPKQQTLIEVQVHVGVTAEEAIITSGILEQFPEIDLDKNPLGVFSKKIKRSYVLRHGDRVEIYRPLEADPKDRRRESSKRDHS